MNIRKTLLITTLLLAPLIGLKAAESATNNAPPAPKPAALTKVMVPAPTFLDVHYGPHELQTLDFYQAKSDKPTPVLFFIHGGSWKGRDKCHPQNWLSQTNKIQFFLDNGISVVAINYRFTWQAQRAGIKPPVEWPLRDAARALQFVRHQAAVWNIDKQRICLSGESAGSCSSLWLAFHADLADPQSGDPIAHESTRPWAAAVMIAQTTLDPAQMKEWTPNSCYGGHAFGFPMDITNTLPEIRERPFAVFLSHRDEILPWIKEYSPYEHVAAGAPPVYLYYPSPPGLGLPQKDPTHTANFGVKLQERCKEVGVDCELVYPGAPDIKHPHVEQYIIESLRTRR